ncbi:tRNA 2-thiouridine(34) synthase MnmA [Candidatus Saccharibacteria bacterium]|nr:MAG: tRNA 2-thiouridine(34) synthase MnmA [Candidatus Saccharibacteria bacterium]
MKKVFVGMSGGVDSSLTAALLREQGYDVTGVYMKNWTQDLPGMICPWADDLADAKRVAVQLDIPFKVLDFEQEYKQKVVDYMIAEYSSGRTPNPDIMCNQEVKFRLFLDTALEQGADMIATGHYARVVNGQLLAGLDTAKDQSYFLYRITEAALHKTLFPLGELKKTEVRTMAEARGLATAGKRDSQGICFVGKVGIREFLSQYVTTEPGEIIDKVTNKVIGHHDGAIFYTFGQRHGLNVGGGLPYYVVGKDMSKNQVFVTTNLNDENLWRQQVVITNLHWINNAPDWSDQVNRSVRLRYRAPLIPIERMQDDEDSITISLAHAERAITPGQSAVLYQGDRVLGGGIVI